MLFTFLASEALLVLEHTHLLFVVFSSPPVLWDCGILIWHPLAGLKSPKCCGGSTSNPRKTPIDPVGQLQRASTSNKNRVHRWSAGIKTCTNSPVRQSTDLYAFSSKPTFLFLRERGGGEQPFVHYTYWRAPTAHVAGCMSC